MPPLFAILNALRRDVRRNLGTFGSLKVNNLFLFIALLIAGALQSGLEPQSAEPFLFLLTLLLLFPLSSDPLQRIPPSRLGLWPLTAGQRAGLRVAALAMSPVLWIALAALLLKTKHPALGLLFLLTAVGVPAVATIGRRFALRSPGIPHFHLPPFPGRLGGLVRNNVRQILGTLDLYAALLLSLGGAAYRLLSPHPDPAAGPILALVVGIALSTYAHCLFGLDWAGSAITRYRLLPLRGWEILVAKDAALLGVLLLLVLPLAPGPGMAFGFTALAFGHAPSLALRLPQRRWRFTGGRVLPGTVQGVAALVVGCAEYEQGPAFLALSVALYAGSLYRGGRQWDRGSAGR